MKVAKKIMEKISQKGALCVYFW